jgi:hypothetical protein
MIVNCLGNLYIIMIMNLKEYIHQIQIFIEAKLLFIQALMLL